MTQPFRLCLFPVSFPIEPLAEAIDGNTLLKQH